MSLCWFADAYGDIILGMALTTADVPLNQLYKVTCQRQRPNSFLPTLNRMNSFNFNQQNKHQLYYLHLLLSYIIYLQQQKNVINLHIELNKNLLRYAKYLNKFYVIYKIN